MNDLNTTSHTNNPFKIHSFLNYCSVLGNILYDKLTVFP